MKIVKNHNLNYNLDIIVSIKNTVVITRTDTAIRPTNPSNAFPYSIIIISDTMNNTKFMIANIFEFFMFERVALMLLIEFTYVIIISLVRFKSKIQQTIVAHILKFFECFIKALLRKS